MQSIANQSSLGNQNFSFFLLAINKSEVQFSTRYRAEIFAKSISHQAIICEGKGVVSKKPSANEAADEVIILRKGSYFGALPIFFDSPSRVTVKAKNQILIIQEVRPEVALNV